MNPSDEAVPPGEKSSSGGIVRAAGLMGLMTLASRVFGLLRDIVCAKAFGTVWQWDAFIFAFMVPNFFRRIVAEGALASAFIPVYTETLHRRGKEEAFRFVNAVVTFQAALFAVVILLLEIGLNLVLHHVALPRSLYLSVDLLRFFFPYLALLSVYAVAMGVLNSHDRFLSPSLSPVILNLFWIAGVYVVTAVPGSDIVQHMRCLKWILAISGFFQVGAQLPDLFRIGFRPRLLWDLAHPGLRKVFSLLLPVIFGFAVVQINMLVDTSCAMWIGPGANSSLWYGTRLMQFPLGVFAVAIGSALLPAVSAQMARREFAQASRSITFSLGMIFVVILPCSIGLMVLKTPIVKLLFEYGKFDAESTARASAVLFYYTIGLFAYAGQKIVITGFYSLQDTRTPMKIAVIALVANIAGNLILMFSMKEAGLALSTSISGILQFGLLISCLHRRVSLPLREILSAFLRTLAASCLMGVAAYFTYRALGRAFPGDAAVVRAVQVLGAVGLGTLTFPVFCMIFGVREIRAAGELFMKRIRARRA